LIKTCCHLTRKNIFNSRRIQADDLPFIAACKEDVKLFKSGRKAVDKSPEEQLRRLSTDSRGSTALDSPPASGTLVVTDQRRERKSKFSVKDIFNLRKPGVSSTDVVSVDNSPSTPEPKADGEGPVKAVARIAAHTSSKKRRNSSIIKIEAGIAVKLEGSGDVLLSSDKVVVASATHVGDDVSASIITPKAAIGAGRGRGGLQTRRRGKRNAGDSLRPVKQDRNEDRNGNSPQVIRSVPVPDNR
jgi:hypothetical protein